MYGSTHYFPYMTSILYQIVLSNVYIKLTWIAKHSSKLTTIKFLLSICLVYKRRSKFTCSFQKLLNHNKVIISNLLHHHQNIIKISYWHDMSISIKNQTSLTTIIEVNFQLITALYVLIFITRLKLISKWKIKIWKKKNIKEIKNSI